MGRARVVLRREQRRGYVASSVPMMAVPHEVWNLHVMVQSTGRDLPEAVIFYLCTEHQQNWGDNTAFSSSDQEE